MIEHVDLSRANYTFAINTITKRLLQQLLTWDDANVKKVLQDLPNHRIKTAFLICTSTCILSCFRIFAVTELELWPTTTIRI